MAEEIAEVKESPSGINWLRKAGDEAKAGNAGLTTELLTIATWEDPSIDLPTRLRILAEAHHVSSVNKRHRADATSNDPSLYAQSMSQRLRAESFDDEALSATLDKRIAELEGKSG